jgi:uncharacterized protein with ParB-like and HNH nuclease domain
VKGRICQFRNPRNLGERELLDARYPRENLIPAAAWAARFRVADLVLSAKDLSFAMLAQFTAGFTEGFDTRDLNEAKALLEELAS